MSDATFTITDLSSFGVSGFQPRIGDRQAAILGIGAGASPGALTLTLVFDHRVANGRLAAMFLADLRDALREGEILDAAMAAEVQPLQQVSQQACDGASCDRCGIGLTAYYERYPQDAVMAVTLRPDGTHGLLCHICASGAI